LMRHASIQKLSTTWRTEQRRETGSCGYRGWSDLGSGA